MRIEEIGFNGIRHKYNAAQFLDNQFSKYMIELKSNNHINVSSMKTLQEKYKQLTYSAGDTSNFANWDRNDFPVSKLFKDNINIDELDHWEPTNYSFLPSGFEDYVQMDVNKIPPGSRSVVIHPDIQSKMDQDPQYAKEIIIKIDHYFQKDILINESILPGCTLGISQFVSIGADGNIDKTCTITQGMERHRDPSPIQKRTKMLNTEILNEIKNTYGEQYFDASKYTKVLMGNDGVCLSLQMAAYETLIKKKLRNE